MAPNEDLRNSLNEILRDQNNSNRGRGRGNHWRPPRWPSGGGNRKGCNHFHSDNDRGSIDYGRGGRGRGQRSRGYNWHQNPPPRTPQPQQPQQQQPSNISTTQLQQSSTEPRNPFLHRRKLVPKAPLNRGPRPDIQRPCSDWPPVNQNIIQSSNSLQPLNRLGNQSYSERDITIEDYQSSISPGDDIFIPHGPDAEQEAYEQFSQPVTQLRRLEEKKQFAGQQLRGPTTGLGIQSSGRTPGIFSKAGTSLEAEQLLARPSLGAQQEPRNEPYLASGFSSAEQLLEIYFEVLNREGPKLGKPELQELFNHARLQLGLQLPLELEDLTKIVQAGVFAGFVQEEKRHKIYSAINTPSGNTNGSSLLSSKSTSFGQSSIPAEPLNIPLVQAPQPRDQSRLFESSSIAKGKQRVNFAGHNSVYDHRSKPLSEPSQPTDITAPAILLPQFSNPFLQASDSSLSLQRQKQTIPNPALDATSFNTASSNTKVVNTELPDTDPAIYFASQQRQAANTTQQQFENMSTLNLDQCLSEIARIIENQDGEKLANSLLIEPSFPDFYNVMIAEIRTNFPAGSEKQLDQKCSQNLPLARLGMPEDDPDRERSPWTAFIEFISRWFIYLRDVDVGNLLQTYNQFSEVLKKANVALNHPLLGHITLPTVIKYSKMLTKLAIGLENQPELVAGLNAQADDGESITLPERAANVMRDGFKACCSDRSAGLSGMINGRPAGKKVGIYTIANLCLKVLFKCKKTTSAHQIFDNAYKQSPPLALYPRAERVTYLYYLGRFQFSMNHFYRAQLILQAAYDECPRYNQCEAQRRLVLIYLLTSNLILGRFPSEELYAKPEARGLRERFQPICRAIARGDLATFRRLTDMSNEHADWFLHYRIFLHIRNRCEVLVWRSLVRKCFILHGEQGDATSKRAPTIQLEDLVILFQYLEKRHLNPLSQIDNGPGKRHTNWVFVPDTPPRSDAYEDPDFEDAGDDGYEESDPFLLPDISEIETIVASLVDQGMLNGFIAHRLKMFAIQGARTKPALQAGFPGVWEAIKARCDDQVPGWKR